MRLFLSIFLLSLSSLLMAQTSGGPDIYGYIWKTDANTDADAPNYSWIDISTTGTRILGLGDDNVVGPVTLGFDFRFYWANFNAVYVGSNGYLSFDNINISSTAIGFPSLPTNDNLNNIVAPFLADLTLDAATGFSNPGRVYSWTNNLDSAIISYVGVPFWNNVTQQFGGSNSFQIIFSDQDSSIVFQYMTQTGNWDAAYNTATNPAVVGIENMTGSIGLMVSNNVLPTAPRAVKFYYPDSVTFTVTDVQPRWVANTSNSGFFVASNGAAYKGFSQIDNVGNTSITNVTADLNIIGQLGMTLHTDNANLSTIGLGGNATAFFNTGYSPPSPYHYQYQVITSSPTDINPNNDTLTVEMNAIDTTASSFALSWWNNFTATAGTNLSWNGGGTGSGLGTYMDPPFEPVEITSVDVFIAFTNAQAVGNAFEIRIYDDNGAPGQGTLLGNAFLNDSLTTANAWNTVTFSNPIRIDSGGFYVAWYMTGGAIGLGMDVTLPFSNNNFEILNNTWATYRFNPVQDPMLVVNMDKVCSVAIDLGADTTICAGQPLTFSPSTGLGAVFMWSNGSTGRSLTVSNPGTYFVNIDDGGCLGSDTIVVGVNPSPSLSLRTDTSFCDGGNVLLDGGAGFSSYSWSSGSTGQTVTADTSGTYTLLVTNSDGCTATDDVTVTVHSLPNINLGGNTQGCAGTPVVLSAGFGFSSYDWSTGATGASIQVSQTGTYSVIVVDANSCIGEDSATVTITSISLNLGADTSFCQGQSLTLDAGSGFQSYFWSNGSSSQTIAVTSAGIFTVTVTLNNCQKSDGITVAVTALPTSSYNSIATSNPQRFQFQSTAQNATTYLWDFGDSNTSTLNSPVHTYATAGVYNVCLTASNDCGNDQECADISTGNVGLDASLNDEQLLVFPLPASDMLYVQTAGVDLRNVQFQLTDIAGKTVLSENIDYLRSGNTTRLNVQNLSPGIYHFSLTTELYIARRKIVIH